MYYKENLGRKLFNYANIGLMLLLVTTMAYPMLYVIFASFSEPSRLMAHEGILFTPLGFVPDSYKVVFKNPMILKGYINTVVIVVSGVAINLVMTSLGAYCLSRKGVLLKNAVMFLIVFTMFFNGGMIPFYFTVKELNLDNTLLALIVPGAINTFNLIILRTAFAAIPDSIEESAKMDGASHFRILFLIIIPLALPTMAVMVLYYGVAHWNAWFNAMLFIRERSLYPLQLILREILITNETDAMLTNVIAQDREMVSETIKYSVITVTTLPILALYPFLQRYFVKGIMIGAIKE